MQMNTIQFLAGINLSVILFIGLVKWNWHHFECNYLKSIYITKHFKTSVHIHSRCYGKIMLGYADQKLVAIH